MYVLELSGWQQQSLPCHEFMTSPLPDMGMTQVHCQHWPLNVRYCWCECISSETSCVCRRQRRSTSPRGRADQAAVGLRGLGRHPTSGCRALCPPSRGTRKGRQLVQVRSRGGAGAPDLAASAARWPAPRAVLRPAAPCCWHGCASGRRRSTRPRRRPRGMTPRSVEFTICCVVLIGPMFGLQRSGHAC